MTADPVVRARRRWLEIQSSDSAITLDQVVADQKDRDQRDENREIGRLVKAEDAVEVDVSELDIEQVVDKIERLVRDRNGETET